VLASARPRRPGPSRRGRAGRRGRPGAGCLLGPGPVHAVAAEPARHGAPHRRMPGL